MYEAGEKRKGTDCGVFIDILTSRNACHLKRGTVDFLHLHVFKISSELSSYPVLFITFSLYLVFQLYSKYSKVDIAKALDLELKGDIENCLISVGETLKPFYLSIALHAAF